MARARSGLDVRPGQSEASLPRGVPGHAEFLRETAVGSSARPSCAYFHNLCLGEFRMIGPLSASRHMTALRDHVANVLLLGAEKQMLDIDASGVIAPMANAHTLRDSSVRSDPGCAVGGRCLPMDSDPAASIGCEMAVPFNASAGRWGASLSQSLSDGGNSAGHSQNLATGARHG